jgi:hypothetical protein
MNEKQLRKLGFKNTMSNRYVSLTINGLHQICKFKKDDFVIVYIGTIKYDGFSKYVEGKQIQMTNVNTIEKVKQLIEVLK